MSRSTETGQLHANARISPFGEFHGTQEPSALSTHEWVERQMCLPWEEGVQPKWKLHMHLNIFAPQERLQRNDVYRMFIICFLYVWNHLGSFSSLSIEAEGLSRTQSSAIWLVSLARLLCICILRLELQGDITPPWCVCGVRRSELQSSCLHDKSFNAEPSTQLHSSF